jgi:PAS domain S-box-containing protein
MSGPNGEAGERQGDSGIPPSARTEILIVEDSRTQAEHLKHILERNGYAVATAFDGESALEILRSRKPGIVISDIMMPGMDGYALCKRIRSDESMQGVAFILLTFLSDPEDVIKGLECGADNFIIKPYEEGQLLAQLEYTLANESLRDGARSLPGVEVVFSNRRHFITSGRIQILSLLLSTYETVIAKNKALARTQDELRNLNNRLDELVRERTEELTVEIAERKKAEERFSKAFHDSPTPMSISRTKDGVFLDINESNLKMLGYSRQEIIGRNSREVGFIDQEQREKIRGLLFSRKDMRDVPLRLRAKSGAELDILASMVTIEVAGESCFLATYNDITERKLVEEQLRQAQKMEAIGLLAGGIAHDFNNLLMVVMGHAQLLLHKRKLDTESMESLGAIDCAAETAGNLTRQLLTFGRKQCIEPQVLDLNRIIADMAKLLTRVIGENISIKTFCSPGISPIRADPGMVEQVIMNLVVNARDAMPKGGQLIISSESMDVDEAYAKRHAGARIGNFVRMGVSDTGTGMTPEILSRVFEPFFTTKEIGKGTGLGLATVYGIVQQHQGWIEVRSQPGKGTHFNVFLPEFREAVSAKEEHPEGPVLYTGDETILIVEDESQLRDLVRIVLEECGYRVVEAATGKAAVAIWADHGSEIDLLFTDMIMPDGMTGTELADTLTRQKPDLKVIFTSGYETETMNEIPKTSLKQYFLQKPYRLGSLAQIVRARLDAVPTDPSFKRP